MRWIKLAQLAFFLFVLLHLNHLRAQPGCEQAPDVIYYNGQIITMEAGSLMATAIAIKDDKILGVGSDEDLLALQVKNCTHLVNLEGLTVLPGFNDSHCHWLSWREHICDIPAVNYTSYPELEDIMENISRNGWTSISELNFGHPEWIPDHLNNAMRLDANGNLKVRLNGYWGTYDGKDFITTLSQLGLKSGHQYSDRIRVPGVKIYVDDPFGTADVLSQEKTSELVKDAHEAGWAVAAHCVNEAAMEKIIMAYEQVLGNNDNSEFRHRIEHVVKVNDDQLTRIKQKGIIASFQLMGPPDWPSQETFMTYISNENPEYILRWKDFFEQDIRSTGSTDAPFNNTVCAYNPFRVIHQAVTRNGYQKRNHASWELAQRLSILQAIKSLTLDGAYATKEESVKGSLAPGKFADLVIVSDNPLLMTEDPEQLLDIEILLTMVGGKVEYCNDLDCSPLCSQDEVFQVDSIQVTVSNYLSDFSPGDAFDESLETFWGSGGPPPQWIELDLSKNRSISKIELTTSQFPAGRTVHQLLGAKDGICDLTIIHEFDQETQDLEVLTYEFENTNDSLRTIQVLTTESPSFVSWYEIKLVFSDKTTTTYKYDPDPFHLLISPNPAAEELTINYTLWNQDDVEIDLISLDGKEVKNIFKDSNVSGHQRFVYKRNPSIRPGLYFIRFKSGSYLETKKVVFY